MEQWRLRRVGTRLLWRGGSLFREITWDPNWEQRHHKISNFILHGKLREAVQFIFEWEKGGVFLPANRETEKMGVTDKTVVEILAGKNPTERKPHFYTLEVYAEITIYIPVDIMGDVVKLVARKLLGISGHGGTDLEALQGWLLKLGDDRKTSY